VSSAKGGGGGGKGSESVTTTRIPRFQTPPHPQSGRKKKRDGVVDVLLNQKGGALHCTTRRSGGPLIGSSGNSYVAHLVSHHRSLGYRERRCGIQST